MITNQLSPLEIDENNPVIKSLRELGISESAVKEEWERIFVSKYKKRLKRIHSNRPIMESEILEAQKYYNTASGCAKFPHISYLTYKKYAKMYNLFKTNPWTKGSSSYHDPEKGRYPLSKILNGEFPNYPVYRLKDLLLRSGVKKIVCEGCGFNGRNEDGKLLLFLNHIDGNFKNHLLNNLKIYCYNCSNTKGKCYIKGISKKKFKDTDRLQGCTSDLVARI